jgi:starch synthase
VPEIHDYEQRINYDYGHINLLKCGVLYADKINAVSPNYASELLTHLALTAWPAYSSSGLRPAWHPQRL